jgi:hypothetical protein
VPVPSVVDGNLTEICRPHHYMGCARAYFMIAARAAIRFDRTSTGYGSHLVVIAIGPGLNPPLGRQRPS